MMGVNDLYLAPDDMRNHLIAWIIQAQSCQQDAETLSYNKEYRAAAFLMQVRDQLVARIMYIQEWADTHTEYPDEEFFKVPLNLPIEPLEINEWWFKYGHRNAVDLAEVIW